MRCIRRIVVAVFLISLLAYAGLSFYHYKTDDTTAPVISIDKDEITVKAGEEESSLLKGVTATDEKDGDLTSQVVVESIGPFLSDDSRVVTYVVCDSSNNIGTASRKLYYKGYHSPEFDITKKLYFPAEQALEVTDYITAIDQIDGDISSRLRLTKGYIYTYPEKGTYQLSYQVSNSAGDVSSLDVQVEIYDPEEAYAKPQISLTKQIIYLDQGEDFDPYEYLDEVTLGNRTFPILKQDQFSGAEKGYRISRFYGNPANKPSDVTEIESLEYSDFHVENTADLETPGAYQVTFELTTADGYTGSVCLSVIVRD